MPENDNAKAADQGAEVVSLMAHRNRRERAILLRLLELSETVPLNALAVCAVTPEGEIIECTGKNSSAKLIAGLRLSRHLNEIADM